MAQVHEGTDGGARGRRKPDQAAPAGDRGGRRRRTLGAARGPGLLGLVKVATGELLHRRQHRLGRAAPGPHQQALPRPDLQPGELVEAAGADRALPGAGVAGLDLGVEIGGGPNEARRRSGVQSQGKVHRHHHLSPALLPACGLGLGAGSQR